MNQSDADRAGLVESHAYAMLDIREVKVSFIIWFLVSFLADQLTGYQSWSCIGLLSCWLFII